MSASVAMLMIGLLAGSPPPAPPAPLTPGVRDRDAFQLRYAAALTTPLKKRRKALQVTVTSVRAAAGERSRAREELATTELQERRANDPLTRAAVWSALTQCLDGSSDAARRVLEVFGDAASLLAPVLAEAGCSPGPRVPEPPWPATVLPTGSTHHVGLTTRPRVVGPGQPVTVSLAPLPLGAQRLSAGVHGVALSRGGAPAAAVPSSDGGLDLTWLAPTTPGPVTVRVVGSQPPVEQTVEVVSAPISLTVDREEKVASPSAPARFVITLKNTSRAPIRFILGGETGPAAEAAFWRRSSGLERRLALAPGESRKMTIELAPSVPTKASRLRYAVTARIDAAPRIVRAKTVRFTAVTATP